MSAEAWVTLATNDSYALGALVLAHSLRRVGTTRHLVVLITPGVTDAMRYQLVQTFDLVESVNVLDSRDSANLALLSRPDLGVTFTKLHCWRLTQFSKCVFLDADTLVLQPCDELFEREELSAAPDAGWPDCFNSGVFVYRPSNETYAKLIEFGVSHGSFDGGDQGLLNSFFSDWATKDISRHLPFIYNMCSSAVYSYLPAFKKFGETVRIAHFIGACKPWMQTFDSEAQQVRASPGQEHQLMLLQLWWDIFCRNVHPHLTGEMGGLAAAFSHMSLGSPKSDAQRALEEQLRREAWERGQVDYLGKDSFDNVWMKIMQTLTSGPSSSAGPSAPPPSPIPAAPAPPPAAPAPPPPAPAPPAPAPPAPAPPAPAPPAPTVMAPTVMAPVVPAPVVPAAPAAPAPVPPSPMPKPPKMESAVSTPLPPSPATPDPAPTSPTTASPGPASPQSASSPEPEAMLQSPLAKQKQGGAAAAPAEKQAQSKGGDEAVATPVAPKRKGGQQQAAGGKGGGKSGGQKGKK
ncbi:glycogenin-1 isoform X2 [Hetaerina americana]|uniref:glycogenin-1 isoform X2 n=1 Tax=Hetaerina americana TaxID=62018 RepID=UPI003A7F1805